ncbi:MAG: hypothetical protein PWP38_1319 [Clostridiales bacterium]|nr:hypothetical protein [Clostridiales bacterium]
MEEALREALERLLTLKGECTFQIFNDLDAGQITMTQLNYLKYVDQMHETTISELSESLNLSKPTVTESIKKLQKCDLVHKRQCQTDGRKYYIELTDKGEQLAHMEQLSVMRLAEKITLVLDEAAVQKLIEALEGLKKK